MVYKRLAEHLYTDGERFYVESEELDLGGEEKELMELSTGGRVVVELPGEVIEYFKAEEGKRLEAIEMRLEIEDALE